MNITGNTKLTGLLGHPVAHSISPQMHNEAFRLLDLDYAYLAFDVAEADLKTAVEGMRVMGVRGFNLTMPDKTAMVALADELTPAAQLAGACNTVTNENGKLIGHTTDGIGFMRSVTDAGHDIIGKTMTLLGAGGAATAICTQAALDGVSAITIFLRRTSASFEKTTQFAKRVTAHTGCQVSVLPLEETELLKSCIHESALLVNATNVGMAPNEDACIIQDPSCFYPGLIVCDIIYNPKETKLLKLAKKAGCQVFNGMYMLLYQGAASFTCWTGKEMPVTEIKKKYFSE